MRGNTFEYVAAAAAAAAAAASTSSPEFDFWRKEKTTDDCLFLFVFGAFGVVFYFCLYLLIFEFICNPV